MFSLNTNIDVVALGFSKQYQPKMPKTSFRASVMNVVNMRKKKETNFYRVLSLESENASFDEIKKAYRSMALRYHPDVCHPSKREESTRMFVELHRAYETLSNPTVRRKYDYELRMSESEGFCVESELSRETWEAQLRGLGMLSEERCKRKKGGFDRNF